jgi:hypothetical protein
VCVCLCLLQNSTATEAVLAFLFFMIMLFLLSLKNLQSFFTLVILQWEDLWWKGSRKRGVRVRKCDFRASWINYFLTLFPINFILSCICSIFIGKFIEDSKTPQKLHGHIIYALTCSYPVSNGVWDSYWIIVDWKELIINTLSQCPDTEVELLVFSHFVP